jgi:hypothetical protein
MDTGELSNKNTTTGLLNRLQKRRPQPKKPTSQNPDGEHSNGPSPKGLLKRLDGDVDDQQRNLESTLITRPPMPPVNASKLPKQNEGPSSTSTVDHDASSKGHASANEASRRQESEHERE